MPFLERLRERMRAWAPRLLAWTLAGIVLARGALLAFYLGVNVPVKGWFLGAVGDAYVYGGNAQILLGWQPMSSMTGFVGYSLLLAPFIFWWGNLERILIGVNIVQAFGLYSLAIILVAAITWELTARRAAAATAAALWAFHPWFIKAMRVGRWIHWDALSIEKDFVWQQWLGVMSDGPATFFLLLGFWLFLRARRLGRFPGWAAVALGMSVLIRGQDLLVVLLCVPFLEWRRERRRLWVPFAFLAVAGVMMLPQLTLNWVTNGNPLLFGYVAATAQAYPDRPFVSLSYLFDMFQPLLHYLRGIRGILLAASAGFVGLLLQRGAWALLPAGVIVSLTLMTGIYLYGRWIPFRLLMPTYPFWALLGGACLLWPELLTRMGRSCKNFFSRSSLRAPDPLRLPAFGMWLGGLVLLRWAMVLALVYLRIPYVDFQTGWYFGHGGDELVYLATTKALMGGQAIQTMLPIGLSAAMVPFAVITGAESWSQVVGLAAPFTSLGLGALSIVFLALITLRLFKNRTVAILAAGLWTVVPYLYYLLRGPFMDPDQLIDIRYIDFVALMWTQVTHTQWAMFFMLLAVALLVSLRRDSLYGPVWVGVAWGLAALVRPEHAVLGLPIAVWYLSHREVRSFLLCAASALVSFLPQFVYNYAAFGSPLNFGYTALWSYSDPIFSIKFVLPVINQLLYSYHLFPIPLALAAFGLIASFRASPRSSIFAVAWLGTFSGVYLLFQHTKWAVLARMMPALPAFLILVAVAALPVLGATRGRKGSEPVS